MKVLVACEFSGVVRDAFADRGHDAWSCDLLPSERNGKHIQGDVMEIIGRGWDLMIAHPPCIHLCVSGARWFRQKAIKQGQAIAFFLALARSDVPRIAVENPIGIMSRFWRRPDQIIQPWMFGEKETKATCLWLKNLPCLQATHRECDLFCAEPPTQRNHTVWREPPGPERWKNRSRTFPLVAQAMADQWG